MLQINNIHVAVLGPTNRRASYDDDDGWSVMVDDPNNNSTQRRVQLWQLLDIEWSKMINSRQCSTKNDQFVCNCTVANKCVSLFSWRTVLTTGTWLSLIIFECLEINIKVDQTTTTKARADTTIISIPSIACCCWWFSRCRRFFSTASTRSHPLSCAFPLRERARRYYYWWWWWCSPATQPTPILMLSPIVVVVKEKKKRHTHQNIARYCAICLFRSI